jgi:hypothetical protein
MIKFIAVKLLDNYHLDNYPLELSFNTGETRLFDVGPYLHKVAPAGGVKNVVT